MKENIKFCDPENCPHVSTPKQLVPSQETPTTAKKQAGKRATAGTTGKGGGFSTSNLTKK